MRTVFKYYKSYIPLIVGILAFLFGQAMCELALPGYMSDIINNGIVKGDMDYIWKIGMIMILVSCGSVVCSIVSSYLSARTAAGSARRIRGALFDKVTDFSAAELSEFSTASLITRSTNDVQMVQQTTVMTLRLACFAPIMGIGAVIKALRTSVSLSWTIGVALAVIVVIMLMSFFLVLPKFKVLQEKLDRINLIMKERLTGLLVIRAFTTEKTEEDRFDDANEELKKINMFVNRAMSFMMPALMFVMNGVRSASGGFAEPDDRRYACVSAICDACYHVIPLHHDDVHHAAACSGFHAANRQGAGRRAADRGSGGAEDFAAAKRRNLLRSRIVRLSGC